MKSMTGTEEIECMLNSVLTEIGKAHGKTVEQVILRWNIEHGIATIPKSVHKNRMEENFAILDFTLTHEEMEKSPR